MKKCNIIVMAGLTRHPLKRIIFIATALFLCFPAGYAQKHWTLEECIQHAISNNITIKQIQLQKESAEINLNTSQMSRLPDLNASAGQNWSFGRTQMSTGLYENQSQSNTSLSIGSSIPLFTGFRISNEIARNKLSLQAATENLAKAKEDLALRIASLFLQVLFDKEILKVNQEQLLLSQTQITKTRNLVDAGKVPQSQLYDIEAQAAKDEVTVIQAKNNLALALLDLAQSLELTHQAGFDVSAPEVNNVMSEYMSSVQPPQIIYNNALNVKPVIKMQEYNVQSAEKALNIAQSGYLPSLSLNAGYGTNYFYQNNLPDDPKYKFNNQIRNNASEYIGLSLGIPIFNRFSVRNQVRSARLNINSQQLELENVKKTLYKEIEIAYLNATAAQEKYRASGKAVKATTESFKYAQERYEVGKSSVFEFNEAKTKLAQSLSEQIQAKYDYIFRTKILDFYNGIPITL